MHDDDIERTGERDEDSDTNAVIAADDTGMVQQQEFLVRSELEEGSIEADDTEAEER